MKIKKLFIRIYPNKSGGLFKEKKKKTRKKKQQNPTPQGLDAAAVKFKRFFCFGFFFARDARKRPPATCRPRAAAPADLGTRRRGHNQTPSPRPRPQLARGQARTCRREENKLKTGIYIFLTCCWTCAAAPKLPCVRPSVRPWGRVPGTPAPPSGLTAGARLRVSERGREEGTRRAWSPAPRNTPPRPRAPRARHEEAGREGRGRGAEAAGVPEPAPVPR